MIDYLKRFKITLTCKSPVHIGSGEKIGKKEYILRNNSLYIPDVGKMYSDIEKYRKTREFEHFLMADPQKNSPSLSNWLEYKDINIKVGNWGGYSLVMPEIKQDKSGKATRFNDLNAFIKNPYNKPYIPGSSLKGCLRNIIISEKLKELVKQENSEVLKIKQDLLGLREDELRRNGDSLKRLWKNAEILVFNKLNRDKENNSALNDLMAAVRIFDSEPLMLEDLTVCQKIDTSADSTRKDRQRPIPTFRECLKPSTKIVLDMTVDTSLLKGTDYEGYFDEKISYKLKMADGTQREHPATKLEMAIRNTAIVYLSDFRKIYYRDKGFNSNDIFLGGGSGFFTKTFLLRLLDKEERLKFVSKFMERNTPRDHKHELDKQKYKISPHTLKETFFNGKSYEFGHCSIKIEQI